MDELKINIGEIKTLREQIAASIRSSIIDGRIRPCERLTEEEIARQLGVSRTPVREAFFQLSSEGFVEVEPRKGVIVREISVKDAEETYELKGVLEALAARLAVDRITPEVLAQLIVINESLYRAADEVPADVRKILDLNGQFHDIIINTCGNTKVISQVTALRRQTLRYNFVFISGDARHRESADEHRTIIDALELGNADEVERLLKRHNDSALASLRTLMMSQQPTDQ